MAILVAISDAATDEGILREAVELAEAFDDELHIVHVLSYDSVSEQKGEKSVKQQAKDAAAAAAEDIDREIVPVGLIGQPAAEILEYAEEIDTRYLVIGGQKRSPVGKALFGSTTQKLLLGAERPVVTVMG